MSDLSILIKALLDPDSTEKIESQIKNLQALFDKSPLKVKLDVDNAEFKAFSSSLEKMSTKLNESLNLKANTSGLDKLAITMNTTNDGMKFLEKKVKEITNAQGQLVKETSHYKKEVDEAGNSQTVLSKRTEETISNYKKLRQEQQKIVDDFNKRNINEIDYKIKQRELEAQQFSMQLKSKMQKEQDLVVEKNKTAEIQKQIDLYKLKMLGDGKNILGEIDIFADKNKGKYNPEALKKIRNDIEALNIDTPELNNKIKRTGIEFSSLNKQAAQSGNIMSRALENAMKFLRFYLVGGLLVGVVKTFKDSISVVKELDDSLTELNKVADLTENQLADITKRAYEAGTALGRTGKEVIDATSEWVRAGYNIEDAFSLSQQSLLLTNIGDGITDVKEASSSLIAILKGFKMEASDTAHVVDALNEVSNNFAVDTNNLTEILKRTSGTLAQTGTSYEQLIGLATGGYESLRSAEMVASGINMISQRLRGMSEDGESVAGLIPKIQEAFDKYTDGAVSIIDKQNGGLNDTYTILEQLSKVYPTLSEEARAYLNEAIAGNRQNKVLVAIMENWGNVEDAVVSATNSTGSALKENEKYLNSIQGKISQFKSETQQMWSNAIDSNVVKFFVDLGTSLIKIIDGFGLWNTVIIVTTASLLLLSKSFLAFYSANIAQHFLFIGNAVKALAVNLGVATGAATALGTAMTMIAPIAIVVGIMGLVSGLKWLGEATERQIEKVRNLKEEYDSLNQSLEDTESKQQQVINRLKELYDLRSNNKITNAEKEELARLENVNTELERQIKYEQALKAIKGEELERETLKLSEKTTETSEVVRVGTGRGGSGQALYLTASQKLKEDLDIVKSYTSQIKKLESAYDKGEISAKEYGKQLEKLKLDRQKQIDGLNELIKKLQEENQNYVGATKEGNAKKVANEALIKTAQDYIISLNEENEILSKLNKTTDDGIESNINYAKSLEEINKVIDTAQSELKDINTLIKDNGKLTADQVIDAIQKYDLLPEHISKTTDGYKIQEAALEDLRKQQIQTTKDSIQAQIDDANNTKIQTAKKLQAYGFEIQTLKDIADAKKTAMDAAWEQANERTGGGSDAGIRDDFFRKYYKDAKAYEEASKAYQDLLDKQGKYLEILNDPSLGISGGGDKGSKYTPSSEESALKALYDAQEISLEIYIQRLIALEKSKYSEYAKMSAQELENALRSRNENIAKKASEYLSLRGTIQGLQSNQVTLSFSNFESSLEPINRQLKLLEHNFKLLGEDDVDKKIDNINQQLKLKNQILDETNKRIVEYNKLLSEARTAEESKLYQDQIDKLTQSSYSLSEAIASDNKLIFDIQSSAVEDAISRMSAIRKAYYQAELDDEEERHKKVVDNLNKELDEYEKFINGKIKALDKLYAKEDYERKLGEFDSEKLKIQAQIDAIALDDSDEGKAQRAKLQKQLDKIIQDKSDAVRDHNRQSEKDMYADLLNIKKDSIKAEQDLEDKRYAANKKRIEDELDDFAIKCKVEQELISEMTNDIAKKYEEMANRIGGAYDAIIEKVKTFNSIANAKGVIYESGATAKTGFQTIKHEYGMSDEDYYQLLANGQRWAELNKRGYNNNNSAEARALHEENERLRRKYGIPSGVYPKYRDGGEVTFTGLAMLHGSKTNPEYVLKSIDFKMLKETINLAKTLMPKVNIPNLSNLKASNQILIDKIETHVYAANGMNEEKLASLVENQVWNNFSKRLVLGGI